MSDEFASKLIALRSEKDLTQQQLADAVGISGSQISRYESGSAMPRKTVLLKLAKALDVEASALTPRPKMRVVLGERREPTNDGEMLKLAMQGINEMKSEEIDAIREEAKAANMPFDAYVSRGSEEGMIRQIKHAVEAGDLTDASLLMVFAAILFGTNIRLEPDS